MGVLKNDVGRPTNKTLMIRRVLKVIAIVIVAGSLILGGYFLTDYQKGKSENIKVDKDDTEVSNVVNEESNDKEDETSNKVYVYKHTYETLGGATEEYYNATTNSSEYDKKAGYTLVNTYECNNNCKVEDTYRILNSVTIYDGKYILYDFINNKAKDITLKGVNQNDINKLSIILDSENSNKIFGYNLTNSEKKVAIYNASLNKLITDYKYDGNYNQYNFIDYNNGYISNYYTENTDSIITVLIDFSNGKEIIAEKADNGGSVSLEEGNKEKYFVFAYGPDPGNYNIYNSDFKSIVKNTSYYGFDKNDNVAYESENKFYVVDRNGKNIYTSKAYTTYSYGNAGVKPVNDYVIVVDQDNYLKLVDYKGNEIHKFVKLTTNMEYHEMLSGWYTENGKNGIYVVVGDPSIKYEDLSDKLKKELDSGAANDVSSYGYEYYYIPKTGETGKIPTYIGGYAKPVLYLYPTKDNTKVIVNFKKPELLTTTYPKFKNNWTVTANKNGDLHDKDGKYYYGLYWEESGSTNISFNTGFYVTKENAIEFLENKLSIIGLNDRERNEFIMYWLPILEKNEKNLVYFELTESRQNFNELQITPKPDSLLRMAIHVKKVENKVNIKEQKLPRFERKGFTAVEWGGVIH